MDTYINLGINADYMNPEHWRILYRQTLQLLEAAPARPSRLVLQTWRGFRCSVITRQLESEEFHGGRHWMVEGDPFAKRQLETFMLCEDLTYYRANRHRRRLPNKDIVQLVGNKKGPHAREVFDALVQNSSCHLELLAAAMWIESCCPEFAYVMGDFDLAQCQQAAELIAEHLGEKVTLPLCVSPQRLMARLKKHYSATDYLDYFRVLFNGRPTTVLTAMLAHARREDVLVWYTSHFKRIKPRSNKAIQWYNAWLNAGQDLNELCFLLLNDPRGPHFQAVTLAECLARSRLTIPPADRLIAKMQNLPVSHPHFTYTIFREVMLKGPELKGYDIKTYIPMDQVIQALCAQCPLHAKRIDKRFRKYHQWMLGMQQSSVDILAGLHAALQPDTNGIFYDQMFFARIDPADLNDSHIPWLDQVARNLRTCRNKIAGNAATASWVEQSSKVYLDTIAYLCSENGVILSQDVWDRLEAEQDRDLLFTATMLTSFNYSMREFRNLRLGILENNELFKWITKRSYQHPRSLSKQTQTHKQPLFKGHQLHGKLLKLARQYQPLNVG